MRALVDKLVGVNSASLKVTGGRRKHALADRRHEGPRHREADEYEAEHPIARTHPGTGRKALYVSRSHTIRFRDMSEEESRPLIDFLQAHQIRPSSPAACAGRRGRSPCGTTAARSTARSTTITASAAAAACRSVRKRRNS